MITYLTFNFLIFVHIELVMLIIKCRINYFQNPRVSRGQSVSIVQQPLYWDDVANLATADGQKIIGGRKNLERGGIIK